MHTLLPCLVLDGDTIPVHPSETHEWTLPTVDVARGYGVTEQAIRTQKMRHADELAEGKHFVVFSGVTVCDGRERASGGPPSVTNCHARGNGNLTTDQVHWTKRGVVRLGFFLRSPRARQFRDAAEDLVVSALAGDLARAGDLPALVAAEISRQLAERSGHAVVAAPERQSPDWPSSGLPDPYPPFQHSTGPASTSCLPSLELVSLFHMIGSGALDLYRQLLANPRRQVLYAPASNRRAFGKALRALADAALVAVPDPGSWSRASYAVQLLPFAPSRLREN